MYLSKNEKDLENQIETIRIYIQDIGIEFSIEKWTRFIMKKGKRKITERIELI